MRIFNIGIIVVCAVHLLWSITYLQYKLDDIHGDLDATKQLIERLQEQLKEKESL